MNYKRISYARRKPIFFWCAFLGHSFAPLAKKQRQKVLLLCSHRHKDTSKMNFVCIWSFYYKSRWFFFAISLPRFKWTLDEEVNLPGIYCNRLQEKKNAVLPKKTTLQQWLASGYPVEFHNELQKTIGGPRWSVNICTEGENFPIHFLVKFQQKDINTLLQINLGSA